MAENVVDKLFVQIGLDGSELQQGLENAVESLNTFEAKCQAARIPIDQIVQGFSVGGLAMGSVSAEVSERVMEIGSTFQKVGLIGGKAMDKISGKLKSFVGLVGNIGAPLVAAFGTAKIWDTFSKQGESLDVLSERLGVSAQKIDAWAKANEQAGGSQEAFKSALADFVTTTGRGADEFFRMGEHIEGLSNQQAEFFLRSQGLSAESAMIFLKYREGAESVGESMRKLGMTKEQTENARAFNVAFRNFTWSAQSLGNAIASKLAPVATKFLDAVSKGVQFLTEHSRFLMMALTALGSVIAATFVRNLTKGAGVIQIAFNAISKGLPILKMFNMALLANPIGAVVAGVSLLLLVLDDLFSFMDGGASIFEDFVRWLGLSSEEVQNLRDIFNAVADYFSFAFKSFGEIGKTVFNELFGINTGFWDAVASGFKLVARIFAIPLKLIANLPKIGSLIKDIFGFGDSKEDGKDKGVFAKGANILKDIFSFGDSKKSEEKKPEKYLVNDHLTFSNGELPTMQDAMEIISQKHEMTPNGADDQRPSASAEKIAAENAGKQELFGTSNAVNVNVENHINTKSDPDEVADAVSNSVQREMTKAQTLIGNFNTGVVQKG